MASKAWYKPSALPQLIARFDPPPSTLSENPRKKAIEVWTTTCIVTNFGKTTTIPDQHTNQDYRQESTSQQQQQQQHHPQCSALINPANPNLSGPNTFPYFPRGGPQPAHQPTRHAHHIMGYTSQWGGMDVGSGMMFSAETIDGLVHQMGGLRLRAECALVPVHEFARAYVNQQQTTKSSSDAKDQSQHAEEREAKCPVGTAVMTSPGGEDLQKHYDCIIHTTPPFYNHPPLETEELKPLLGIGIIQEGGEVSGLHSWSRELLRSCYRQSFDLAFENKMMGDGKKDWFGSNPMRALMGLNNIPSTQQNMGKRVAVPLLGAGCRTFAKEIALEVAALESVSWLLSEVDDDSTVGGTTDSERRDDAVVFGLLETADADALSERIERELSS